MLENNTNGEEPTVFAPKIVIQKNWDLRRKIIVISVVPLLMVVSIITTLPVIGIYGIDLTKIPISAILLATLVAEWLVILWAFFFGGMKQFAKDYFKVPRTRSLILAVILGILGFLGLQLGAWLIQEATGTSVGSSATSTQLAGLSGPLAALVLIGVVGIIGPFTEEVLFRGVVVGSLQHSTWKAPLVSLLVSGVLFGAMHAQGFSTPTDFFVIFWTGLLGVGFAALFLWKKSIWMPATAHMAYNLVTSGLILIGMES